MNAARNILAAGLAVIACGMEKAQASMMKQEPAYERLNKKIKLLDRNPLSLDMGRKSNTTGVPTPFVVEYCIYIENYEKIERLVHKSLSDYNFNKEFFKHDLIKCILELKRIAHEQSSYKEKYRDTHLRSQVEGWESRYLREIEEKKQREIIARKLEEERIRKEQEAREAQYLKYKKEQEELLKKEKEESRKGCLILIVSAVIGYFIAKEQHSIVPFLVCVVIGFLFTQNWDFIGSNKK